VLHVEDGAGFVVLVADLEVERQAPAVEAHVELAARARAIFWRVEVDLQELGAATVVIAHDDLVGDVDEFPRQVARVSGSQGGIGAALTSTVGGDEVLENVEPFTEVRAD